MSPDSYESSHTTIQAHGTSQIEIKSYCLFGDHRRTRYFVEAAISVPQQLGIALDPDGVQTLLKQIRSNTRFQAANFSMQQLGDPQTPDNPIGRISAEIDDPHLSGGAQIHRFVYEIRTFCNLYAAQMKSGVRLVKVALRDKGQVDGALATARNLVREGRRTLSSFRKLRLAFLVPTIDERVRDAHRSADEYLGGQEVRYLLTLSNSVERIAPDGKVASLIKKTLDREIEYQKNNSFETIREFGSNQQLEAIVNRESRLKKWVQATLYLNTEESRTPKQIGHAVASVAAASVMAVAVVAAFSAEQLFVSYSLPWVLLIVGSYMLKDRIKEILRGVLQRYVPSLVSDRTRILIDPSSGKRVGKVRIAIRSGSENVGENESTVIISNAIVLKGRALARTHRRVNGILDILRIHTDQFLRNMDAPRKALVVLRDGKFDSVMAPRTYRIRVVVTASFGGQTAVDTQIWWIVLNRNGVVRLERAKSPDPAGAPLPVVVPPVS